VVEAKKDGVTTLWITNNGKNTYQLQTGEELAEACQVDLELLDNEVTVTPVCLCVMMKHLVKIMRSWDRSPVELILVYQ